MTKGDSRCDCTWRKFGPVSQRLTSMTANSRRSFVAYPLGLTRFRWGRLTRQRRAARWLVRSTPATEQEFHAAGLEDTA